MLEGVRDIGISLLNVDQMKDKNPITAIKCEKLGSYLITSIVRKNREHLHNAMKELLKHKTAAHIGKKKIPFVVWRACMCLKLFYDLTCFYVFLACLALCITQEIRSVVHSSMYGRMVEVIHHIPLMSVAIASPIIKALIPAFQLSNGLLNQMMIVLRKTIWK